MTCPICKNPSLPGVNCSVCRYPGRCVPQQNAFKKGMEAKIGDINPWSGYKWNDHASANYNRAWWDGLIWKTRTEEN